MRFASSLAVVATASLMFFSTQAEAYGVVGHALTGQIAQEFLSAKAKTQISQILDAEDDSGLLSNVSSWADNVRRLAAYKWTANLHFFNPVGDNPPERCTADYVFDGQDNVNALYNMTATLKRFQTTAPTSAADIKTRQEALKFVVHFMGDIHQPLHDSTRDRGGNDAKIKWGKTTNNLHSMWDTLLITKDIQDRFNDNPQGYLDDTLKLAKTHWKDASTWSVCGSSRSTKNPWSKDTDSIKTLCPIQWATEANALDCSYVWKNYSATRDYSTDYFQQMTGSSSDFLVQRQLAMAGVRMAALLNELYDPSAKAPLTKRGLARLPSDY
ncbi:S1/P1 nuclease [Mortierella sp. GBAus27b]|nr:hypothetical protein BGX31_008445 [Mortierella sp. GBA43]KAI8359356.1 S1/P1 nuclease [Mortierella sp. GBAus27b]